MNVNKKEAVAGKCFGRNRFSFKYTLECGDIYKKYCSITDIMNDPELEQFNLDRQKIYRIRHNIYSTNTGTSATALIKKGYGKIKIESINDNRPYKLVLLKVLIE